MQLSGALGCGGGAVRAAARRLASACRFATADGRDGDRLRRDVLGADERDGRLPARLTAASGSGGHADRQLPETSARQLVLDVLDVRCRVGVDEFDAVSVPALFVLGGGISCERP